MARNFRGLKVKTTRSKEQWTVCTRVYVGVSWRQQLQPVTTYEPDRTNNTEKNDFQNSDTANQLKNTDSETEQKPKPEEGPVDILRTFGLTEKMSSMIKSQLQNVNKKPHGRRWDPEIIKLCLTLYCRSPKNYEFLYKGGYLILPSPQQIQRYKNQIDQKSGTNKEMLEWMKQEALLRDLPQEGFEGGLLIDEMSVQEDLRLKKTGDDYQLIGFVDTGEDSKYRNTLMGKHDMKLATHVLQLLFLGHTGFRFPIAHYPTSQASPSELYRIFWDAVKMLSLYGFHITYLSVDGAQSNRVLMKMLIPAVSDEQTRTTMLFSNIFDCKLPQISFIMDYSHVMKKIRNNILKSGITDLHKRLLTFGDKHIVWDHWVKSFEWDIANNSLKVYQQLTQDHFFLSSQLKMRNKLAEEVLNENMMHLMQLYKTSLGDKGAELNASIELLKRTSVLVNIYRDYRPITASEDPRLCSLRQILAWFKSWEDEVQKCGSRDKHLFSSQTREDISSMIIGFDDMCTDKLKRMGGSIIPARINSDPIENIFSQQRGIHNGPNTNPDYLCYSRSINTIVLGEKSISRKSNAKNDDGAMYYKPTRK